MQSTSHLSCNILADLLIAHGIRHIVLSPGSRNTPLILALTRRDDMDCHVVIDERSAAFIALGMSIQSDMPTALVCTSGTALLNYAPAVAEAFYRHIPLVVISADRPEEWIDQDDSQTIWQQDALAPYVKRSCDISARIDFNNGPWWTDRMINDVLLECLNGRPGPVHINIRLDAPLHTQADYPCNSSRVITMVSPASTLPVSEAHALAAQLTSPRKVLIIAGFHHPDKKLNHALVQLASQSNMVVMTESISNMHSPKFIDRIDSTLCRLTPIEREQLCPDTVITLGGAIVSRHIKEWLRSIPNLDHWHVGISHTTIDCFKHLSKRIDVDASIFLKQIAASLQHCHNSSDYAARWHAISQYAHQVHDAYVKSVPWSDLKAFSYIFSHLPRRCNLHLSNGTPIRYAQLLTHPNIYRSECNRGVSGIDGCTSTAIGASVYHDGDTILISGDMSFQYDIAALSSTLLSPKIKMIVICNGGGGIFRFISATSSLPETDRYFVVGTKLPLRNLCNGYGIAFFTADSEETLPAAMSAMLAVTDRPALLAVYTLDAPSAEILKNYFTIHNH